MDDDDEPIMESSSFSSSSDNPSLSSSSDAGKAIREVGRLAKKETKDVETWRELVTGVLVITSIIVGIGTFIFLTKQETNDFWGTYNLYVDSIEDVARWHERNLQETLLSISDSVSAHAAIASSSSSQEIGGWPYVTVPFFDLDASHAREMTNTTLIAFSPLVEDELVESWESYVVSNQWWTTDKGGEQRHRGQEEKDEYLRELDSLTVSQHIYSFDDSNSSLNYPERKHSTQIESGPFAPIWQMSPSTSGLLNFHVLSYPKFRQLYNSMVETRGTVISDVLDPSEVYGGGSFEHDHPDADSRNDIIGMNPHSIIFHPVFEKPQDTSKIAGFLQITLNWKHTIELLSPPLTNLRLVLKNSCGKEYTYETSDNNVTYIGEGDLHEEFLSRYDSNVDILMSRSTVWDTILNGTMDQHHCSYKIIVHPTRQTFQDSKSRIPVGFTIIVAFSFFVLAFVFFIYDKYVKQRNDKVVQTAARSNAIVSSLFPTQIRDRLFETMDQGEDALQTTNHSKRSTADSTSRHSRKSTKSATSVPGRLKSFLSSDGNTVETEDDNNSQFVDNSKPIADLFPNTTVLFADIVGFTAWSSVREPSQVFILLETIYHTFDQVARIRRVFKVETVGDCYMAVTGLPDPRKDHAVVMARFACDCMNKMHDLSRKLEVTLGPDTGDLSMRFGIHSGPVTAGVLRGKRSRFQLFGDTVNTASRMESTGLRGRIHMSAESAALLEAAGKSHWLVQREDKIVAKGKGELTTYWLILHERGEGETSTSCSRSSRGSFTGKGEDKEEEEEEEDEEEVKLVTRQATATRKKTTSSGFTEADKLARLINWNVEVLSRLLKQIVARRNAVELYRSRHENKHEHHENHTRDEFKDEVNDDSSDEHPAVEFSTNGDQTVLEEVKEIITLPEFDSKAAKHQEDPDLVELDSDVVSQLHHYVSMIASLYKNNPFHNFEHASHVTMSVVKLLSRIVAPTELEEYVDSTANATPGKKLKKKIASKMHDHTYGITSDPLTQFSVVLSALIHDVEHSGVPNAQLVKENAAIAAHYKGQSVAEQNSVDVSWSMLMQPRYEDLRNTIYSTNSELLRFRQLIVNSVMATDIIDKELKELRNGRWDKAFKNFNAEEDATLSTNRKATIVIEHLLQASDVSHTMQHWHIFRKWNERLFGEMYKAFKDGRAEKDPSGFWYKGEIGFFDFYIIPLAKKLKDCGVFGVSSDEYLNYAMKNRDEWEKRGEEVVKEMIMNVVGIDQNAEQQ